MINLGELQYSNICLDSSDTNDQQPQEEQEKQDVEIICGVAGKLLNELLKNFVLVVKDKENNALFVVDTEEDSEDTIGILKEAIKDLEGCL